MAARIGRRLLGIGRRTCCCRLTTAPRYYSAVSRYRSGLLLPSTRRIGPLLTLTRSYHENEIEEQFEEMVKEYREIDKRNLGLTVRAQLDAYYKQVTVGPCDESPGSYSDMEKAMMVETWGNLGDMAAEVAMANFIEVIKGIQQETFYLDALEQKDMSLFEEQQMAFTLYGSDELVVSVKDHVQTIRFNRPARRNALTISMYHGVVAALAEAARDDDIYLTVLTGSGEYYCSGNDLNNFNLADTTLAELIQTARNTLEVFVAAFIDHPKPIVGAVNGPAIGIAVTTLGLCDLVLVSGEATLHTPFTSLGQSPEGCSSYLFPRIMGPAKANDVLLLGHKLTAREAVACRLATRVVSPNVFERDYTRMTTWMASLPQDSLRLSRNLIRSYDREKLHEVNRLECDLLERRWASKECHMALEEFTARQFRKTQSRLGDIKARDQRLVGERVEKLQAELSEQSQLMARLPSGYAEYPELNSGVDHHRYDSLKELDDKANKLPSGQEKEEEGNENGSICSNEDKKDLPPASTPWK